MFPSNLWIADPNEGKLYKVENDVVVQSVSTEKNPRAVCVSQDMISVYTVNRDVNSISHFRDGAHVKDISVGALPYGICEDSTGAIYVTNYSDNTISKIYDGVVVATIATDAGPRGIVCDSTNTVWVTCFLSSTVTKIVNDTKVASIKVGQNPEGITCDPYDNIWTANYGSNSVSKITRSVKILDIEVNRGPIAIVSDSTGNIFVANYFSDDVTILSNSGSVAPETIPVGDGPTAIGVVKDDSIYVTSGLGSDIRKIKNKTVISTITVCDNPTAFGDFTGCATYNVYNIVGGGGSAGVPDGGWLMADMSTAIQQTLNKVINKIVETSADKVSYHDSTYDTVEKALDKVLSQPPKIESFEISKTVYEFGEVVSSLNLTWKFNGEMDSVEIRNGSVVIGTLSNPGTKVPASGTKVITGTNIVNNSTITLVATSGTDVVRESIDIVFKDKYLFGAASTNTTPSNSLLTALNKSDLVSDPYDKSRAINCNAGSYLTVAFPKEWGVKADQLLISNIQNNDWAEYTVSYTNQSNGTKDYTVFVFNNMMYGADIVVGVLKM